MLCNRLKYTFFNHINNVFFLFLSRMVYKYKTIVISISLKHDFNIPRLIPLIKLHHKLY